MLMWKIVEALKASVLYVYIDNRLKYMDTPKEKIAMADRRKKKNLRYKDREGEKEKEKERNYDTNIDHSLFPRQTSITATFTVKPIQKADQYTI